MLKFKVTEPHFPPTSGVVISASNAEEAIEAYRMLFDLDETFHIDAEQVA